MINYCKKSSIDSIASEIKTNAGISQTTQIPFNSFVNTIESFVIPIQRGNPSVLLSNNNNTYTIQQGIYTGGTISVEPQSKTATLSKDGSTITPDNNKVLSSVIIPAKNVYTPYSHQFKLDSNTTDLTRISISNLPFQPVGIILIYADVSNGTSNKNTRVKYPEIAALSWVNGIINGVAMGQSSIDGVPITSANITTTSSSITISNVVATENSNTFQAVFETRKYVYFVWG